MIGKNEIGKTATIIKYGMVGGGEDAFIGDIHRRAIGLDGKAVLTAGCFTRSMDNTLATGEVLHLEKNIYIVPTKKWQKPKVDVMTESTLYLL
ncbi:MAG: hypothetical protein KAH95_01900 [Spirochaetales bacterium]|nr:hypothetical protein [Spirochaetales bacterium]